MTPLTAATVHKSILDGFIADDVADFREALSEMFNVDKKHGPLHRLEASWWKCGHKQKPASRHSRSLSLRPDSMGCPSSSWQGPAETA